MAPGGIRRKVSVANQVVERSDLSEDETLSVGHESNASSDKRLTNAKVAKKKGRRKGEPTTGFEVRKRVKEGSKINGLVFDQGNYLPVGPAEKLFKMETGVIARKETPHHIFYWKSMEEDDKKLLFEQLEKEFQICLSDPHTRQVVDSMLATRFRNFKYRCHLHYKKFSTLEEARKHPPPNVDMERWLPLCQHFENPKFQLASEKNTSNRDKVVLNHTSGSKSYCQRMYEMDENMQDENLDDPSQEPKEVKVYYDVHRKKDGSWIHPQAKTNYEKMTELCKEPTDDGVHMTGSEIVNKVVKPKSSKARGNRVGRYTLSASNCSHAQVQDQEVLIEKLESQQAVIDELLSSQKQMHTIIEKLRRKKKKKARLVRGI